MTANDNARPMHYKSMVVKTLSIQKGDRGHIRTGSTVILKDKTAKLVDSRGERAALPALLE